MQAAIVGLCSYKILMKISEYLFKKTIKDYFKNNNLSHAILTERMGYSEV